MTTINRSRRSVSAPAPQRVSNDQVREALSDFANRVTKRLESAPRFQSVGRNKYVYVGDVAQALDEELYGEASGSNEE